MTDPRRPLLWHQGLFLQPQHFQQLDLHIQSLLTPLYQYGSPFFWGFNRLEIQKASLQNRSFELVQGEAVFPDGTWVVFPGNAVVQPRSFQDVDLELEGDKPFRVYLGLQKNDPMAKNVTSVQDHNDLYSIRTRLASSIEPEEVKDLHLGGSAARTRFMDYVLKVFWETELEELGDYLTLPVAQLSLEGDQVVLSDQFVPPLVSTSGSEALIQIIRNIQEQIKSRSRILEMYKIRDVRASDLEGVSLRYILALSTVNRYVPVLEHLLETPVLHPWTVYGFLRQLIGELSTFTNRMNALGKLADGTKLLPDYTHTEIGACFTEAQTLIGELLGAIVVGEENIVHLIREESYFKGAIPAEAFSDRNLYFLAVTTTGDPETIVNSLLHHAKIGSAEEMSSLLARALPGIPLEHQPAAPPGFPQRPDAYYFSLDGNHPLWIDIRRSGNICLYWDEAPEDASGELVISRA